MLRPKKYAGTTKEKSDSQERKIARQFKGNTTPGSGNKAVKGDVQTDDFTIECKTTSKKQYVLKLADFQKHFENSAAQGKTALFLVQLDDEAKGLNRELVVLSKVDFFRLIEG